MLERWRTDEAVFPTRRSYFALALGFVAFAIYGSLIPFDLQQMGLAAAWDEFTSTTLAWPQRRISRSDLLANVLLFVPIGFTLAGGLAANRPSRWALVPATLLVVPITFVVSVAAEFLQLFFSERVSSGLDIAAQTIGAIAGIAMWGTAGAPVTRWLRETWSSARQDRVARVLTAYTAAWAFVNLAPFDITVDLGDLAERVRSGRIAVLGLSGSDASAGRQVWDALAEICSAIPLGAFAVYFTQRRGLGPTIAFVAGAALVLCVEGAQVFIQSHSANVTDLLLGSSGVGAGVVMSRTWLFHTASVAAPGSSSPSVAIAFSSLVLLVVFLCAYHWQPYDFTVNSELIRLKLQRLSLVPFAAHAAGSYLNALKNVLVDFALSIPVGVCLAFGLSGLGVSRRLATAITLVGAIATFGVVESGQFFLPTRTPDPTDVLLGAVGVYLGLRLGRWVTQE